MFSSLLDKLRRWRYMRSEQWRRDKEEYRKKTGFDWEDPICKKYSWVPPDMSLENPESGFYEHNGRKYIPVNGKMVEIN